MERDNYDEFIEDDETDIYQAARRYTAEVERLTDVINLNYPSIAAGDIGANTVITPFTVNSGYYASGAPSMYSSVQSVDDIAELKRTLSYIQAEVAGIKKMLSNTAEKINSLEHRKITL